MNELLLRRALIGVCVAVAVANGTIFLFFQGFDHTAIDFRVFWLAVRRTTDLLYASGNGYPFIYPPTALLLFKPLALLDFVPAYIWWVSVSLVAYYLAVKHVGGPQIALLSMLSLSIVAPAKTGQVSIILAAAIVGAFALPPLWCGVVLGVVLTIKPHLVILAPLALVVRRDWRAVVGMAAGAGFMMVAGLALFGLQPWFDWVGAFPAFRTTVENANLLRYMVTPAGVAEYYGIPGLPALVAGTLMGCAAVALSRRVEGIHLAALIVAGSLLSSPYAMPHDMAAIIPACAAAMLARPRLAAIPSVALYLTVLPGFALAAWVLSRYLEVSSPTNEGGDPRRVVDMVALKDQPTCL